MKSSCFCYDVQGRLTSIEDEINIFDEQITSADMKVKYQKLQKMIEQILRVENFLMKTSKRLDKK